MLQAALPTARRLGLPRVFTRAQSSGSFFRDLTGSQPPASSSSPASPPAAASSAAVYKTNKDLRAHPEIAKKLNPAAKPARDLFSPLKQQLYEQNLANNNGVFKNNQLVPLNGKLYKLSLTKDEERALEPTVYVQSYRIKGSWKKTYMFLRLFRKLGLNDAITQCHFSARRMARDIGEMLERGSKDAEKLGLDPESLVVDQIWVGKDGDDPRRLQVKGRGRTGVITSHYVHVKAILKPREVIDRRDTRTKERLDRKLWFPLTNFKIKEDYVQTADYKW